MTTDNCQLHSPVSRSVAGLAVQSKKRPLLASDRLYQMQMESYIKEILTDL
ncbi:hypothetical protein [Nostoc sp.]|uniref:hypothetical protein n=1 Tax=Nostoc sp. TaxID=1180 RepID=UPI002FF58D48